MSKEAFERRLADIESLRSAPDIALLRKALGDRSNYLAAKAAAVAGDCGIVELTADLLANYGRFFEKGAQTDKQCWAKAAIVRALKKLSYPEPEPFLKGLYYVQMEPVWKGVEDTAITLRGECAHALIACEISRPDALRALMPLLGDAALPVRRDAVRAIAQFDGLEAELALRTKAIAQPEDVEVTGECLTALVSLQPPGLMEFMTLFLDHKDPAVASEAAVALASTRDEELLQFLIGRCRQGAVWKEAALGALAASTLPASANFLLCMIEEERAPLARAALRSLASSRFSRELKERVRAAVTERTELQPDFDELFPS